MGLAIVGHTPPIHPVHLADPKDVQLVVVKFVEKLAQLSILK